MAIFQRLEGGARVDSFGNWSYRNGKVVTNFFKAIFSAILGVKLFGNYNNKVEKMVTERGGAGRGDESGEGHS